MPAAGSSGRSSTTYRGPERSLVHAAYNRGKRSVRADRVDLIALAATADVVLDSQAMGVDLAALRAANPGLVTVTISAFGETGPKADWLASDLTIAAASGQLVLTGDDDRAPVRISEPQVFHHAALEAAVAAVVALAARRRTGEGQHVDVSAQQAFMQATQGAMLTAADRRRRHRAARRRCATRFVQPCASCTRPRTDTCPITFLFGDMIGRFTQRLMHWVWAEGHCTEEIRDLDYVSFFELFRTGQLPPVDPHGGDRRGRRAHGDSNEGGAVRSPRGAAAAHRASGDGGRSAGQ